MKRSWSVYAVHYPALATLPSLASSVSVAGLAAIAALAVLAPAQEARTVTWSPSHIESRIPRADLQEQSSIDGIIVLGGGVSRVRAALDLAQPVSKRLSVILSGPGNAEIALARDHLSDRLVVDRRATNTFENATFSRDLLGPCGQSWVLVTSALHMPRAIGVFQAVGFPVQPWPVPDTPTNSKGPLGPGLARGPGPDWLLGPGAKRGALSENEAHRRAPRSAPIRTLTWQPCATDRPLWPQAKDGPTVQDTVGQG